MNLETPAEEEMTPLNSVTDHEDVAVPAPVESDEESADPTPEDVEAPEEAPSVPEDPGVEEAEPENPETAGEDSAPEAEAPSVPEDPGVEEAGPENPETAGEDSAPEAEASSVPEDPGVEEAGPENPETAGEDSAPEAEANLPEDEAAEVAADESESDSDADFVEDVDKLEDVDWLDEAMPAKDLLEVYDETLRSFQEGQIIKGTIVSLDQDDVLVDIGYKSEGYIPLSEFDTDEQGSHQVHVGDEIDVYLVHREDADGLIVLSKEIADQKLIWDEITQAYEDGQPIKAVIVKRIKGGLRADIGTMRAFLPASQVDIKPVQDLDQHIGQEFEMKVIKLSRRRRNIVLSRRALLEEELAVRKEKLLATLQVGDLIEGEVKNITQFGAFVDLGGVDGLLHKSDMSWGRVNHPSEKVKVGDEIEVMVLQVNREEEKVSLGLKQKTPDPWLDVDQRYPVGDRIHGKIVNLVDYGAFVELEEGVEGLLHVSEMSWTRRIVHPNRIFKRSDEIEAVVLDIDRSSQRISLGLRQLQDNPWDTITERYPVGTKIRGKVRNLTDFGAFVEVEEGIDGLIHVSDLSWAKRVVNPSEILKEGDEVEVVVLSIDASNQRISLGLKQVEPDPWIQVPEKYKVGTVVQGTIVNLTSFGAFAKLEEGVEGLIHISELADHHVNKPEEVVAVGQILDLKVISLDPIERRIGLSLKAYLSEQTRAQVEPYRDTGRRQQQQQAPQREEEQRPGVFGALLQEELSQAQARRRQQQDE